MVLQTPDCNMRSVCYRKELREKLVDAAVKMSPVKIRNFKRKPNFFDNTKDDIEVNNHTEIQLIDADVPFKYQKLEKTNPNKSGPKMTISTIQKCKQNKDIVHGVYQSGKSGKLGKYQGN